MTLSAWLGFLLAAILIAVTPGPGAVISMSIGVRSGFRAALTVIAGLQAAILIHLLIVALGLGALMASSEWAFGAIKVLGACYLVWLGIQKWRAPSVPPEKVLSVGVSSSLFLQGLLVNLTNPKAIVFIGALVPQFIDPLTNQFVQYAVIALTLCLTDVVVMSCYALAAARLGGWMNDPLAIRRQNLVFGSLFVVAGGVLAVSSRPVS